jgi:hypothetical protein
VASYYLHQRFINAARLFTARFKETNGRLPSDAEFASLLSPSLNQPLPPPVSLTLANGLVLRQSDTSAAISGTLAQGVYGDDEATVWIVWGRTDGGTSRSAWEQSLKLGLNTNFNPTTFTAAVTNLVPQTNYFFRFYATNNSGEAWAPTSAQFTTLTHNPSDYGSRLQLTFPAYNRGEVLPNFPVLVSLNTNLLGFSYKQFASPDGGDLRFTAADGVSLLYYEIDEWLTNGTSTVWVRIPQLTGTNDFIWAYWGNPLATSPPSWSTNGQMWALDHLLVWHLKESRLPYADSAGQHPAFAGVAPASIPGLIGRGGGFNGSSQYLDAGLVNLGDAFTLSAWVNISPAANDIQTIWANQQGRYASPGFAFFVNTYQTADQKIDFGSGDGVNGNESTTPSGAVSFGQWHQLAAAVNRTNGTVEFFLDGADVQSGSVITDFVNQAELELGRFTNNVFYFTGAMDEVRIQRGTASANWLYANWLNVMSNDAFVAYSSVVQGPPVLSISGNMGGLLFTWPASAVGFALYAATNLAPPVGWSSVTNSPVPSNSQWQVTLQPDATRRFFRLQ